VKDIATSESISQSYANVAELRAGLYRLFTVAFRLPAAEVITELQSRERTSVLLDMMGAVYSVMPATAEKINQFKDLIEGLIEAGDKPVALQVEYARLFVGPFKVPAPPYESMFRVESRGSIMGESTMEVRRLYREEGLDLSSEVQDLPDHILAELDFMSYLCDREAELRSEGSAEAETYLKKQEAFLSSHLTKWIPQFSQAASSATREDFYRLLAGLTDDFIALDHDYVKMLINSPVCGGH